MANENGGYIKIYRHLRNWGWYKDANTMRVFVHLLLLASFKDNDFRGQKIKAGQVVCGRKQLAKDLKMSEQSVRTSIKHLISTNEITIESTNRFSVITIVNWAKYQSEDAESSQQTNQNANTQLTSNQPATNHTQECKEIKNIVGGVEPAALREAFEEWMEMRKRKGKPLLTTKGVNRALNTLARISDDVDTQIMIIHDSINNNWLSFYPLKEPSRPNGSNGKSNGKAKELEDTYAMIEEWANGSN